MRRGSRLGIDLFIEDGAYTTLASTVTMLAVLALLFSAVGTVWGLSRSGDTQLAADSTAMAGANVVSSYHTAATALDAMILSLGLAGFCVTGVGLVGLLVPGANAIAGETVDAGIRILEARNDFAASASEGLQKVEQSLPYLVAANAARTCAAQGTEGIAYTGTAVALPRESASEFPAIEGEGVSTEGLAGAAEELDEVARRLEEAQERTADAKRAAWLADCGRDGRNMQERAASLSGLSAAENPDFASSITWEPMVAIERARAYYRWRLDHVQPEGSGTEARADAAARRAFYRYALGEMEKADFTETEEGVACEVPLLPRNTSEVKATSLYTEAVWPSSREGGSVVLHYGSECPGATGGAGPALSLSAVDSGGARLCEVCRFDVGDLGKTPAASTSIDNGFEYHLREFTLALEEYASCRDRELEIEREARSKAEGAGESFEEALSVLAGKRPRIAPPGRDGCVAFVVTGETVSPEEFESRFSSGAVLPSRGAIAGAACAPDPATRDNNVLAQFFSSLEERSGGGGAVGLVDDVMGLWGEILMSYEDLSEGLGSLFGKLTDGLELLGMGLVATWLEECVDGAIKGLGFEPVDLDLMKPVLVDTERILKRSGASGASGVLEMLRSLPIGSTDPAAMLGALGYEVGEHISEMTFTIAEIPLPGGGSIPLTIRLRDVLGASGAGSSGS